jgi:N5-hydroxy-L-ornithine N5-transacylase
MAVLAKFDNNFFAYFEMYWVKEDHLGAYYNAGDYDHGRHSLVGDTRFRSAHRVMVWWYSLMHYIFLDDPCTTYVVGEPNYTNATVLTYDFAHRFNVEKLIDLPHKRSAFVRCPRAKFFQIPPFGFTEADEAIVRERNPDRILKL